MNCGRLPTTERIFMAAANTNHPMTRHFLLAGFSPRRVRAQTTRDVQWYVARRLSRPEAHRYNALPSGR